MSRPEKLKVYAAATLCNVSLLVLGAYLVFEKVVLAIMQGETEERAGMTERVIEPVSFWISVGMFGFFGAMIFSGGVYGFWLTFGRKSS